CLIPVSEIFIEAQSFQVGNYCAPASLSVMQALTVRPGKADTLVVDDIDEPGPGPDELLVDGLAIGVCGTDKEIAGGQYGWAPPGRHTLVIGHESLGRVAAAPP